MIAFLALMACNTCGDFECWDPRPVSLGEFAITRSWHEDLAEGEVLVDPEGYVVVNYRDHVGRSWVVKYRKVGGSIGGESEGE